MNEDTQDIVSEIKSSIFDIEDRIEILLRRLENEVDRITKEDNEDGELCFELYIKAGFTIGTKFVYKPDNTEWTITGINPRGFVVTGIVNGEERKLRLPAYDKNRIEKSMHLFEIIGKASIESEETK